MAVTSPLAGPISAPVPTSLGSVWADGAARTPLVPVALALTSGIVLDRLVLPSLAGSLAVVAGGLVAWAICQWGGKGGLAQVYLLLSFAGFGAFYHHWSREIVWPNDISCHATDEPRPVQLRGSLASEPIITKGLPPETLPSIRPTDTTRCTLRVTQFRCADDWQAVSGRVRLVVEGSLEGPHVGDEVQVVGRLSLPRSPSNPGEFDQASYLRDQGIRSVVWVKKSPQSVSRLREGWRHAPHGWLAVLQGWGQRTLHEHLPAQTSGVAMALLLGEGSTMTDAEYEPFLRTGTIHVLAISGQHLVVLAWFVWWAFRLLGVRRRRIALLVALLLLGYALLTGGRPPVMRAAIMVGIFCGSILLRRQAPLGNTFALAWLVVALLNPADIFNPGCQLSFLAVAVLCWGMGRWFQAGPDPLDRLLDVDRPIWQKLLRAGGRWLLITAGASALIWLATAPLVAARYHLVSPAGIVLTPPLLLLTSIALIAGFLLLAAAAVGCGLLVTAFAWIVHGTLAGSNWLVHAAVSLPGAYAYVSDVPEWWLWIFYFTLIAVLLFEPLQRRPLWIVSAGLAWLCVGLLSGSLRANDGELRCTFLAVGHGGCIVLETPDGRTLLYDAGAMSGPDMARRQIAPYLWQRGIHRIDEIMLSHADLDHFNGVAPLLERFRVGGVTLTPSFAERSSPAVQHTIDALRRQRVPVRIVKAGDRLTAGLVEMAVLHPPAIGPEGNENTRSLILLIRHEGRSLLLTGDLEGPGLKLLLSQPLPRVDVLMAPHHGGTSANSGELADRLRPAVVISSQGRPQWPTRTPQVYEERGAHFLSTWPHGAVTVRSRRGELVVETFRTQERRVLERASGERRD